jgi:hypothetical protein
MDKNRPERGAKSKADAATEQQINDFAHHFSEVMRIAKTADFITTRFYNDLADAWCDYENSIQHAQNLHDTPEMIALFLRHAQKNGLLRQEAEGGESR